MKYLLLSVLAFLIVAGAFVVTGSGDSKASPSPAPAPVSSSAPCPYQPLRNGPAVACIN